MPIFNRCQIDTGSGRPVLARSLLLITLKFGGSSLADLEEIRRVLRIIEEQRSSRPAVVVSAIGEMTDVLERLARQSLDRDGKFVIDELNNYFEPRLYRIIHGVVSQNIEQQKCLTEINRLLQELKNVYRGLTIIRELTPRALDTLLSYGELFSQIILFYALKSRDIPAARPDASRCIITDNHFGHAGVRWDFTTDRVREQVLGAIDERQIPVIQGFIGGTEQGTITTLGRGGSDYTAAVIGAICEADEIQIWTDVDGFLTADPSVIPEAGTIPELNINEAKELAQFGARVLHPKSVLPAIEREIPVYIRNTFAPENPGTLLSRRKGATGIHSLTALRDLTVFHLEHNHPDGAGASAGPVGGEVVLSVSTPTCQTLVLRGAQSERMQSGRPAGTGVTARQGVGLIGLVGEGLSPGSATCRKVLEQLEGTDFEILTGSPGGNRWLLLLDDLQVDEIMQKLYTTIFDTKRESADL